VTPAPGDSRADAAAATAPRLPALFDLSGRSAVVTGAASGIGLAIAEAMLDAGAHLLMSDADGAALAAEATLHAIDDGRFYVLPHVQTGASVEKRMAAILSDFHRTHPQEA
jgi:NAD(P)-dependent dehydrogenase (short-subunit alcohol dehydrogenase family)